MAGTNVNTLLMDRAGLFLSLQQARELRDYTAFDAAIAGYELQAGIAGVDATPTANSADNPFSLYQIETCMMIRRSQNDHATIQNYQYRAVAQRTTSLAAGAYQQAGLYAQAIAMLGGDV